MMFEFILLHWVCGELFLYAKLKKSKFNEKLFKKLLLSLIFMNYYKMVYKTDNTAKKTLDWMNNLKYPK